MKIWALQVSYLIDQTIDLDPPETPTLKDLVKTMRGDRDRYIAGLYSTLEQAETAAAKFLSLTEEDTFYCSRTTCITEHTLDRGWYEEFHAEPRDAESI